MPIHESSAGWVLECATSAYALGVDADGRLVQRYWGPRLPYPTDYPPPPTPAAWSSFEGPAHAAPEVYPAQEGITFAEPAIGVVFADAVRGTLLRFVAASSNDDSLQIVLRDPAYPLEVTLCFTLFDDLDLITQHALIANRGDTALTLTRAWSFTRHLPPAAYHLSHLTGRWADEFTLRRESLPNGLTILESRRLHTSHRHVPFFAIDQAASEEHGPVWFATLAWSGAWKLSIERTEVDALRIGAGLNDWDFALTLAPGSEFSTPQMLSGFSNHGFGTMSRHLHRYIRTRLIPHAEQVHPVLYNSWEATFFDVDAPSQMRLADLAADLGVELFVVDDGWFHGRNDETSGLGDWWPDAQKFPAGLAPLIDHVHRRGMQFGLWIEPEMVNPQSELYRHHPDWVIHQPTRPRTTGRHQLVLNLARVDVQDHLITQLDALLRNHRIAFIKWDMNRSVSEPGWPAAPGDQRELYLRYVEGLYRVWGTLRERHPQVIWQSCSGGGGRADLGILRFADQIWPSDNTIPTSRLAIQDGFSRLFPAITMEAWVTDMGPQYGVDYLPLSYRFHASMCGVLGIGGNLLEWSEAMRAEARALTAQYKAIRHIVQFGEQYRLRGPADGPIIAVQYVAADGDEALLFAFRTAAARPGFVAPIRLRGLDPLAYYQVEGAESPRSGGSLMQLGVDPALSDYRSTLLSIKRV